MHPFRKPTAHLSSSCDHYRVQTKRFHPAHPIRYLCPGNMTDCPDADADAGADATEAIGAHRTQQQHLIIIIVVCDGVAFAVEFVLRSTE